MPTSPAHLRARAAFGTLAVLLLAGTPDAHASGTIVRLKTLGGSTPVVYGLSADGSTVVGDVFEGGRYHALRWTAAGELQDLGTILSDGASARAVSADGAVVCGRDFSDGGLSTPFRWTAAEGMSLLGGTSVVVGSGLSARAVSADGLVIAGTDGRPSDLQIYAFRWTAAGVVQDLGALSGGFSTTSAISADGSTVVGTSGADGGDPRAFRWTATDGMQDLGTLGGAQSSARGASADGSVVVGTSRFDSSASNRVFRWTAAGGMQDLGITSLGGMSADGSVIAGTEASRAIRWTAAGGLQDLGDLGGTSDTADAVSADGGTIAGRVSNSGTGVERAFLWTESLGMVDLNVYLPAVGIDLTNWHLKEATHLSADGSVIVGKGRFDGETRIFRVEFSPCGSVDFDGDGDEGTDADVETFFRVIGGGTCAP